MKVYAITCNQHQNTLLSAELFSTIELARKRLLELKEERQYNFGVHMHEDTLDLFNFTLGWEEHFVSFKIVELSVK